MGEGLLLGLSWLDGSVSAVLPERKVVKVPSILCCLSNHVEVNFLSYKCFGSVLFSSGLIRLLDFLIHSVITVNTVSFVVKIFLFFVLRHFVSGVCLFVYYTCLLFVYFMCAGSVGISLAGRVMYFLCV
jgi:hypothetical protein